MHKVIASGTGVLADRILRLGIKNGAREVNGEELPDRIAQELELAGSGRTRRGDRRGDGRRARPAGRRRRRRAAPAGPRAAEAGARARGPGGRRRAWRAWRRRG